MVTLQSAQTYTVVKLREHQKMLPQQSEPTEEYLTNKHSETFKVPQNMCLLFLHRTVKSQLLEPVQVEDMPF